MELYTQATNGVIVRLQPPAIAPRSPLASSTTNRLQVPFGFPPAAPVNAEVNVSDPPVCGVRYGPAGAGAAKASCTVR